MDYKKKYEELLARLQEAKENVYKTDERYCCVIDSIVPELKERIRKALIRFHKSSIDIDGIKGADIIAWLEEQGEKGTNGNEREIPNFAWNEEDEKMLSNIVDCIKNLPVFYESLNINGEDKTTERFICDAINWLKSFKDRVQPQNLTVTDEELGLKEKNK